MNDTGMRATCEFLSVDPTYLLVLQKFLPTEFGLKVAKTFRPKSLVQ